MQSDTRQFEYIDLPPRDGEEVFLNGRLYGWLHFVAAANRQHIAFNVADRESLERFETNPATSIVRRAYHVVELEMFRIGDSVGLQTIKLRRAWRVSQGVDYLVHVPDIERVSPDHDAEPLPGWDHAWDVAVPEYAEPNPIPIWQQAEDWMLTPPWLGESHNPYRDVQPIPGEASQFTSPKPEPDRKCGSVASHRRLFSK